MPLAVHPKSSSMISTSAHPSWRARSTNAYCSRWLSRLFCTWPGVDWRMYTQAVLAKCSALILLIAHPLADDFCERPHPMHEFAGHLLFHLPLEWRYVNGIVLLE